MPLPSGPAEVITEDVLADVATFGFRVRWQAEHHIAGFEVFEICGRDSDGSAMFWRAGEDSFVGNPATSINEAQSYMSGTIKWDACAHLTFGALGDEGYIHLCGLSGFQAHAALMRYLYTRAYELMGRQPEDGPWEE